ncbi:MAG: LysR substrate-binding domain-containing protein [Promethearchaeota archaeon]
MRLDYLRDFIKLCEYRNFSKLAKDLTISQSTLSHRISQLEKDFGNITLIERTTKRFKPTREGEIVLKYGKKILELFDSCQQELMDLRSNRITEITISSSTIPGSYILPKFITSFKTKHPNVEFNILINNSQKSIELLKKERVDFAGVGSFMDQSEDLFDVVTLAEDELVFICSPSHEILKSKNEKIKIKDILKYPFINREEGSGTRDVFEKNFKEFNHLQQKLVINDNDSIITAVNTSNYISVISKIVAKKAEDGGLVKIIPLEGSPFVAKRNIHVLKLKGKPLLKLKKEFWNFLSKPL